MEQPRLNKLAEIVKMMSILKVDTIKGWVFLSKCRKLLSEVARCISGVAYEVVVAIRPSAQIHGDLNARNAF